MSIGCGNCAHFRGVIDELRGRIVDLESAIQKHHDAKGHDRCLENDRELYRAAGLSADDIELPSCPQEMLHGCVDYVFGQFQQRQGDVRLQPLVPPSHVSDCIRFGFGPEVAEAWRASAHAHAEAQKAAHKAEEARELYRTTLREALFAKPEPLASAFSRKLEADPELKAKVEKIAQELREEAIKADPTLAPEEGAQKWPMI